MVTLLSTSLLRAVKLHVQTIKKLCCLVKEIVKVAIVGKVNKSLNSERSSKAVKMKHFSLNKVEFKVVESRKKSFRQSVKLNQSKP